MSDDLFNRALFNADGTGTIANNDQAARAVIGEDEAKAVLMAGSDGTNAIPLKVDATGALVSTATIAAGDIEIGAVELKNAVTDDRALISDANTARAATNHVLSTQNLDAAGLVHNLGTGLMAGSAPITLATDDTQIGAVGAAADVDGNVHGQLRSIAEAAEIIDDSIVTDEATHSAKSTQVAGVYQTAPTELTTGQAAAISIDSFHRVEGTSDDRASGTKLVTDLTAVSGVPFSPGAVAALTAPDQTAVLGNVDGYLNHIVSVTIASVDTDVTFHIEGSIDGGTTYDNVAEGGVTETETANDTKFYKVTGPFTHLLLYFDAETGGNAVTLTGRVRSSN